MNNIPKILARILQPPATLTRQIHINTDHIIRPQHQQPTHHEPIHPLLRTDLPQIHLVPPHQLPNRDPVEIVRHIGQKLAQNRDPDVLVVVVPVVGAENLPDDERHPHEVEADAGNLVFLELLSREEDLEGGGQEDEAALEDLPG
jgi:hypothetical protein